MGSDIARISFAPTREYRSVVTQQGRVTLEADVNEQNSIASEALRLETIDLVGPAATPDDGYKVQVDASGALIVGAGTMYLGGWRLQTGQVDVANQPEWLDRPSASIQGRDVVALLAIEQNVSAVEDQPLREVALGGPDTAARTRLMQHFVEIPVDVDTCPAALGEVAKLLNTQGLLLNAKTFGLTIEATLKVSFFPPPPPQDPCCPPAQGGYLGADNQLVRVTVTSYDPNTQTGMLLWSFNNASFLYRAALVDPTANPQVLTLSPAPVDPEHTPQPGQAIEVLRTTMVLGDPADNNCIAAPQGEVITLGTGTVFDPNSNQLTLPTGTILPAPYQSDKTPLFVRLWQDQVPFTNGQTVQLDNVSGLAVTVHIKALPSGQLLAWPFWEFAVRPNTPQQVYPQRYLQKAQFPDGPRQWICDLAIVEGSLTAAQGGIQVVRDCRVHFEPLPEIESCTCCNLVLAPSEDWLGKLNEALASNAIAVNACFQPGQFTVATKIMISGKAIKMTGAGTGTVITGASLEAVMEFDNCPSVNLSDLSVVAETSGFGNIAGTTGLQGAVTIRNCTQVDIERVSLTCADADIRSASCLAVYNPVPVPSLPSQSFNVRVLNSQFQVGHSQVGILMVNADRAQIEGNRVVTPRNLLNLKFSDLANRPFIAARLEKSLLHALTVTNTAPPTTRKQRARQRRKLRRAGTPNLPLTQRSAAAPTPPPSEPVTEHPAATAGGIVAGKPALPRVNLGGVGLARVRATFGTFNLEFVSSEKLTNAWTDAIRTSGLTATSTMGAIHTAVKKIASAAVRKPESVSPAFRNFIATLLPQLFSTSSQGIVVGGNLARDIRILNNTIDGTAQGIHVGLSDLKLSPRPAHLIADRVQICGNTVNVRLTPEMTGDRHGIFLGCVTSGIVSDNQMELTREPNAGQDIFGIKIAGFFGPSLLIERNCMLNFTYGIFTAPDASSLPKGVLWKTAENVSNTVNYTSFFKVVDNVP